MDIDIKVAKITNFAKEKIKDKGGNISKINSGLLLNKKQPSIRKISLELLKNVSF